MTATLEAAAEPGRDGAELVPATGPVWRWVLPAPPDVRLDDGAGVWCPLCDGVLFPGRAGWRCDAPSCLARWDFHGEHGRWQTTADSHPDPAVLARIGRAVARFQLPGPVSRG